MKIYRVALDNSEEETLSNMFFGSKREAANCARNWEADDPSQTATIQEFETPVSRQGILNILNRLGNVGRR